MTYDDLSDVAEDPQRMTWDEKENMNCYIGQYLQHLLPYTAENGVQFSTNGVTITTRCGIIVPGNYYWGSGVGERCWGMNLNYCPDFSREPRYERSIRVMALDTAMLDELGEAVQRSLELFAKNILRGIGDR